MLTDCKCSTNIEAKLDPEANKVICTKCFTEIPMSDFTKNMMRQRNDVIERKVSLPPNGLLYTCDNKDCSRPFSAEVDRKDDKVHCPYCDFICKISDITIARLKESGVYKGYSEAYLKDEGEAQEVSEKELTKTLENEVLSAPLATTAPKRGRGRPRKVVAN